MADRVTGLTTRLAMEHVLHGLNNPGTWVMCCDHHEDYMSDVMLYNMCLRVLDVLGVPYESRGYSFSIEPIQFKEYPKS